MRLSYHHTTMSIHEDTLLTDIRIVGELLDQMEQIEKSDIIQRTLHMNTLFHYLIQHPQLIHQYETFRATVISKMFEMSEEVERQKAIADPEGGEINEDLMSAATLLQSTIERLSEQIVSH